MCLSLQTTGAESAHRLLSYSKGVGTNNKAHHGEDCFVNIIWLMKRGHSNNSNDAPNPKGNTGNDTGEEGTAKRA
jgi:hypothetical protein